MASSDTPYAMPSPEFFFMIADQINAGQITGDNMLHSIYFRDQQKDSIMQGLPQSRETGGSHTLT
jgi:hypothetical protein